MDKITEALYALSNPTLEAYLKMLEDTESPPLFHAWALISAASACLTRRSWFKAGAITVMPNQYIMLVGPAGVRKSSAIRFAKKLLQGIPIRYSPNSTAGRLQGLVAVMAGDHKKESDEDRIIRETMEAAGGISLGVDVDDLQDEFNSLHVLQRRAMYIAEGELVSFLGMKMDEFITFLGDMWDKSGEDSFTYSLKRESVMLEKPCLNMIGGITPLHITTYLPAQAIGQGFTSRVIMVYADKAKRIAWPEEIPDEKYDVFRKILRTVFDTFDGAFSYTPEAKAAVIKLYEHKINIDDTRFIHYADRRQTHMFKIAMALAALRTSMEINEADIMDAHALLVLTEKRMAESLGEYGLDKSALAKSRIMAALKHSDEPLSIHRLVNMVGSDVPRAEINKAAYQMSQDGTIIELNLNDPSGMVKIGYVWPSEVNPFKRHDDVAVSYYFDEHSPDQKKPKHKATAVDKAVSLLGSKQVAPDVSSVELRTINDISEGLTLAAQGFSTVTEKLASIVALNKSRKETMQ